MQRNASRVGNLLLGCAWQREKLAGSCFECIIVNAGAWRLFAHGTSFSTPPSTVQRRAQTARTVPFLTTDDFGRPTVIHRSPDAYGLGNQTSGTPYDVAEDFPPQGRKRKFRPKGPEQQSHVEEDRPDTRRLGSADGGALDAPSGPRRKARAAPPPVVDDAATTSPEPAPHKQWPSAKPLSRHAAESRATTPKPARHPTSEDALAAAVTSGRGAGGAVSARARARRGGAAAASAAAPLGPASRDRQLTFRLLKASSLRELHQLLSGHPSPPNMIHLAAAARQAVLLGSLPQPRETRELLDSHLQRLAGGAAASPAAAAADGSKATAAATGAGSPVVAATKEVMDRVRDGGATGQAAEPAAAAPAVAPPPSPLREVGDILWAYGKLQCKPPPRVWSVVLRPVLLDPAAWQQLREAKAESPEAWQGDGRRPPRRRRAAAAAADAESGRGSEGNALGRDLSKVAVALARMRELDSDVWRVLARATAGDAAGMSPRALSSTLWAFGSVRMTHGSLLAASVHAVHPQLRQLNAQDLVCVMWALSRLAPPPDGGSRAAAAATAARGLLYGDLSDAVRRCLQLRGFKPSELTTLIGVLDEMAEHQQQQHAVQPFVRQPGAPPRAAPLTVSPRLLRVVSQAVRKNVSSLPVGSLAVAACAFQRLGHADAALCRALAAAMALRLRHAEPRHLLRGAAALQAAGHCDRAFFGKVLEAARPRLASFKRHELLAMTELCSRLLAGASGPEVASGGDSGAAAAAAGAVSPRTFPTATGATAAVAVDAAAARAFLHAAVLHAVSAVEPVLSTGGRHGGGGGGGGGGGSAGGQQQHPGGDGEGGSAAAAEREPLRLRHWHRLLRAAAAGGWRDEDLANRAVDAALRELRSARAAWLTAVRTRAAERAAAAAADDTDTEAADAKAEEAPSAAAAVLEEEEEEDGAGSVYDTAAGDVAGVVATAAALGLRRRIDVVEAAVFGLLEALRVAEEVLEEDDEQAEGPRQQQQQQQQQQQLLRPQGLLMGGGAGGGDGGAGVGRGASAPPRLPRAREVVALPPAALGELQRGLAFFGPELGTLETRRTRIAVQALRQRLRLWEAEQG